MRHRTPLTTEIDGTIIYLPTDILLGLDEDQQIIDGPGYSVEVYNPTLEIKSKVDEIFILNESKNYKDYLSKIFPDYVRLIGLLPNFRAEDVIFIRQNLLSEINQGFNHLDIFDPTFIRSYNGTILLNLCIKGLIENNIDRVELRNRFVEKVRKGNKNVLAILYQTIQECIISKR